MNNIIEQPIVLTEENDFLGTLKKAEAITNFIEHNEKLLSINNMIALYGEWGSGKSSIFFKLSIDSLYSNFFTIACTNNFLSKFCCCVVQSI